MVKGLGYLMVGGFRAYGVNVLGVRADVLGVRWSRG